MGVHKNKEGKKEREKSYGCPHDSGQWESMTLVLHVNFPKAKRRERKEKIEEERKCSSTYLITIKNKQKVRQKRAVTGNDIN